MRACRLRPKFGLLKKVRRAAESATTPAPFEESQEPITRAARSITFSARGHFAVRTIAGMTSDDYRLALIELTGALEAARYQLVKTARAFGYLTDSDASQALKYAQEIAALVEGLRECAYIQTGRAVPEIVPAISTSVTPLSAVR